TPRTWNRFHSRIDHHPKPLESIPVEDRTAHTRATASTHLPHRSPSFLPWVGSRLPAARRKMHAVARRRPRSPRSDPRLAKLGISLPSAGALAGHHDGTPRTAQASQALFFVFLAVFFARTRELG